MFWDEFIDTGDGFIESLSKSASSVEFFVKLVGAFFTVGRNEFFERSAVFYELILESVTFGGEVGLDSGEGSIGIVIFYEADV